ncbi:hypothetical protein [Scopulibacillus cellulosilyticus]|uniref:Uncharacterized protein n=1 Tax=Scopulibacillus cellulosilyticus TaxID=2665665 RepID=A0ABW2PWS8_9BACL
MAHLIKLDECISRYQLDLNTYINRFIQIKRRRFEQWKTAWETQAGQIYKSKLRGITTQEEFKAKFHLWLFKQQIKWATSTAEKFSECPPHYLKDHWLKQCLAELNDVTLLFCNPVIQMKKAAVPLESIILTPYEIWCVKHLQGEKQSVFQTLSQRKWREITSRGQINIVNPLISLRHTGAIVSNILKQHHITRPVRLCLLSMQSYIENVENAGQIEFYDCRGAAGWLENLNKPHSLLKHDQLVAAKTLYKYCSTKANNRKNQEPTYQLN